MNYKSFTQIVILGSSAFVPFMQLSGSNRREVIEDLLDIRIFSAMNSIIKDKIRKQKDEIRVLDLFAGTGNISFEFASRGTKKIISVDNNLKCVKFIKETSVKHGFDIITKRKNYIDFLMKNDENFDIIFADPPYLFSIDKYFELLNIIRQRDVLLDNGQIIIEHSSNLSLTEKYNDVDERKYGGSVLSIIKKASL